MRLGGNFPSSGLVVGVCWAFLFTSLECPLVAEDLPLDELFQLLRVRDHVLVRLDLHVRLHDAQVDSGQVDLPRVFLVSVSDEGEMGSKVFGRLPNVVLWTRFIMEQTKL